MSIFRRKKRERLKGKGTDEIRTFHKTIEVLNYTPMTYLYTESYWKFRENAEKIFRKKLENIPVNELCTSIFDSQIQAEKEKMKQFAKEQHTEHLHLILHNAGILGGELVSRQEELEHLTEDLSETEKNLEYYRSLESADKKKKDHGKAGKEKSVWHTAE